MNKDLKDQLREWEKKQQKNRKPRKSTKERFSESDLKSLMGVNRPIYGRGKGGAIRQK
ncbi:hypothetical protein [Bacillus niameyensis]|uniref:hypothetical protein n=1 Tax=Bacillus niameyensis TaxID=1522308 RepID=UPI000A637EF1|nr:hypothetical protein [Bacillus niameyensis]